LKDYSRKLEINWQGLTINQGLDYVVVPFRCSRCKETGHLRHQCTTPADRKFSGLNILSGDRKASTVQIGWMHEGSEMIAKLLTAQRW
jgi:hypothetical protein